MPLRVDWAQIKNAWAANDDRILVLDQRAINIILSSFAAFHWPATFDKSETYFEDRDEIDRLMSAAELALGSAMRIQDLIQYIDDIESLLVALNQHAQCCGEPDITDGDQYTDKVTDGVGDVPQNIIDAGYATDASDWDGFDDYKCIISHIMVSSLEETLRQMLPHIDSAGLIIGGVAAIAALIGAIWATGGAALVLGIIGSTGAAAAIWGFLTELLDTGTEQLADDIATHHDDLACAIYGADGSEQAITQLFLKVDELFGATEAALIKNLNVGPRLKGLYSGRYNQQDIAQTLADAGYEPGDFDCSCVESVTPTELDIYAVSFFVSATGTAATNGLGPSAQPNFRFDQLSSENYIIRTGTAYNFPNASNDGRRIIVYPDNAPAGWDTLTHDDEVQVNDTGNNDWHEDARYIYPRVYAPSYQTFEVILSAPKIFCDAGAGYQWYDASITNVWVDGSTSKLFYSTDENWLKFKVTANKFSNWSGFGARLVALVPD